MKIKVSQLRSIIKEEVSKVLSEGLFGTSDADIRAYIESNKEPDGFASAVGAKMMADVLTKMAIAGAKGENPDKFQSELDHAEKVHRVGDQMDAEFHRASTAAGGARRAAGAAELDAAARMLAADPEFKSLAARAKTDKSLSPEVTAYAAQVLKAAGSKVDPAAARAHYTKNKFFY